MTNLFRADCSTLLYGPEPSGLSVFCLLCFIAAGPVTGIELPKRDFPCQTPAEVRASLPKEDVVRSQTHANQTTKLTPAPSYLLHKSPPSLRQTRNAPSLVKSDLLLEITSLWDPEDEMLLE